MTLSELITSKALQSKLDGRIATLVGLEEGMIVLDMEKIGLRRFPKDLVENGFIAHADYKSLVKGFISRQLRIDAVYTEEMLWSISCQTYDLMSKKFVGLTNVDCYQATKELLAK